MTLKCCFLCVGHGEAKKFLGENKIAEKVKIIDLSQDFRLSQQVGNLENGNLFMGFLNSIKKKSELQIILQIPGCFATGIQLGLLPLAKAGLLEDIHTTGITGSTGAGQGLMQLLILAGEQIIYRLIKLLLISILGEIGESLKQLQSKRRS